MARATPTTGAARPIPSAALPAAAALLLSCADGGGGAPAPGPDIADWSAPGDVPRVQAVVDVRDGADGWLSVRMRYDGLTEGMDAFRQMGKEPELTFREVRFSDADGDGISASADGRTWELGGRFQPTVIVDFEVQPGGDGRHGRQGKLTAEWAVFDGRVFLTPVGGGDLQAGRVRMEAPAGWTTASPLPSQDGWLDLGVYGPSGVLTALVGTCYGVGPFVESKRSLGRSEVREYHIGTWPARHQESLSRGSLALFEWFHRELGFDPGFPMAVVWTPDDGGKRVYGGSSANGTCMEHPKPNPRAYELMAHRIAHAMNKYSPSGMQLRDEPDAWFKEGWPSYIEAVATEATDLDGRHSRWTSLQKSARRTRKEHPEHDLALKDEGKARGEATEYLHYFKGPLVVRMLDDWLRRRHGKDLTEFMRLSWQRHGNRQSPLPLREALEAWSGANLDDFWAVHVDQRGWLYPVGLEALTDEVARRAAEPGDGTVGGRPITADYLTLLLESGEFARYGDIVRFVEQEEPRRAFLASLGIALVPPEIDALRAGLDPADRFDLAMAERAWPIGGTLPMAEGQGLVLDLREPRAALFAQLVADEAAYEAALLPMGIDALLLHQKDAQGEYSIGPLLSFPLDAEVRLQSTWASPAGRVKVRARRGDQVSHERTTTIWPDWTRAWSPFSQSQLPSGPGVVTFEVELQDGRTVARSFWRRAG